METNFNLGSLKIVQGPLMDYFKAVLENAEGNLRLLRDEKKVATNHEGIEHLKKIQKTLDMIGLKGLSKVLSVAEEGLNAVKEVRFDSKKNIEVLELSVQILQNGEKYVKRLVNSGYDQPTKFYPQYARLASLLLIEAQIKDLFFPKLDFVQEVDEQIQADLRTGIFINENSKKNLVLHLEKVYSIVQTKFPILFNTLETYGEFYSEDEKFAYQNVCKQLYEAFDYAQKLKINKNFYILFGIYKLYICILSPIFNQKFVSYIGERQSLIKMNLTKFERVIARLMQTIKEMEVGDKTGNAKPDDESVKEILFELVNALNSNQKLKEMPVYSELEEFFDIEHYISQLNEEQLISSIAVNFTDEKVKEIEKVFLDIKEDFNTLALKKPGADDFKQYLVRIMPNNKKLSDLIATDKEIKFLVSHIGVALEGVKNGAIRFNESLQKEISLALVLVDYGINNFVKHSVDERLKRDYAKQTELQSSRIDALSKNDLEKFKSLPMPKLDSTSQKADEKKTFSKIFEQLNEDITKIEETLDYFLKNEGENVEEIGLIYKPLLAMRGIFSIIGKPGLTKVVNKIAEPLKKIIDNVEDKPSQEEMQQSIALVSGLSLLVKAFMAENDNDAEELHGRLMKVFYSTNLEEMDGNSFVPEFKENADVIEETVSENAENIENEDFVFNFGLDVTEENTVENKIEEKSEINHFKNDFEQIDLSENNSVSDGVTFIESTNDPELAEVFLEEAEAVFAELNATFEALDNDISNKDELNQLRRYFHTLKGSGRMVGLEYMGEAGWMAEQTLNRCIAEELEFNEEIFNLLKVLKSRFEKWVKDLKETNEVHVDLVTLKKEFLRVNEYLTNYIEIKTGEEDSSSLDLGLDLSFDDGLSAKETQIENENQKETSSEFNLGDFSFASDDAPIKGVEDKPVEEFGGLNKGLDLSFADDDAPIKGLENSATDLKEESFEFNFEEATAEPEAVTLDSTKEESFDFNFEESTTETEAMNLDTVKEENFETVVETLEQVVSTDAVENESADFNFEEAAADNSEIKLEPAKVEEASVEMEHPIELSDDELEEEEEDLIIDGVKVSKVLFEIFEEESNAHIDALKEHAHLEYNEPVVITQEFMRHAHTLSSIAASVHLTKVAKIAHKLEDVSNVAIERNIALSQLQMNAVRHVVDNIDLFKQIDNSEHASYYESLMSNLNNLYDELHMDKEVVVENSSDELYEMDQVQETNNQPLINVDKLKQDLISEISLIVGKNNDSISQLLESNSSNNKQLVESLLDKIGVLEEQILKMREEQLEKERIYNKALETTKNDIRTLAHILKKKYELTNQEVLSENNGEINSNVEGLHAEIAQLNQQIAILFDVVGDENSVPSLEEINKINLLLSNTGNEVNALPMGSPEKEVDENTAKIIRLLAEHDHINNIFEEKVSSIVDEIDMDIYEISKEEAEEMFENINPLIEKINEEGLLLSESQELKRYLHTFKGSVRMAGANKLGMLAHRLESLLDYAESRKMNLFDLKIVLEKEMDKISFMMKNPNQELDQKKINWLDELVDKNVKSIPVAETNVSQVKSEEKIVNSNTPAKVEVKKETKQYIKVLSDIVDSAISDAGEIRLSRTSLEDSTLQSKKSILELKTSSVKLLKMVKEIEIQAETQIQAHSSQFDEHSTNFDPLEFDRFTRLQELTRLMNEAVSDIEETVNTLDTTSKVQDNTINAQSIVTNNLLSQLMKVRLVPVESISDRFYKIARNTSKELGKRVSLEIIGEKNEVDKLVLDKMISPIEHILRNSIAHGIELSEERTKKGKSSTGKVSIDISLDGNFTIVKISDDGAGINVEKIREIGIKKKLIEDNKDYSRDEIINLIFQSGFSTADTVSQVAGRGVGMDVVKNEILAIGGSVKIETEKDKGSVFILTLPMEVATSQAMLCVAADKLVAIPAILIEEVASIKEFEIKKAYDNGKITLFGVEYQFYSIAHLLGIVDHTVKPEFKSYNSVVRIKYLNQSIVIHLNKLITTSEIVIKSLGTIYGKIFGVLGVTLLGDGRQGVVINPIQLLEHYNKHIKNVKVEKVDMEEDIIESINRNKRVTVMVVDDSITVRRASSKVLERNNYNVVLAKDGEDALEQLQISIPDIILSDIEMPRMDGFEFVKNLRKVEKYNHIPVIMITSRTAEKHQNHAFELGANDFLGKPYKEEALIEKIELLLEKSREELAERNED